MIEIIKAGFSPGEIKTFNIQGEYLEILECDFPITVVMLDRNGVQLSVMRNAESSYFSRPGKYEVIQITSPEAQTIRVFVGSGDAGTRKTSGNVVVIDNDRNKALSGGSFSGSIFSGVDSGFPYVQIWNPEDSGKILVITNLVISMNSSGNAEVFFENSKSGNLKQGASNKKSGGVIPIAEFRGGMKPVIPTYPLGGLLSVFIQGNIPHPWAPKGGLIVMPGYGLTLTSTNHVSLLSNFEWSEQTI